MARRQTDLFEASPLRAIKAGITVSGSRTLDRAMARNLFESHLAPWTDRSHTWLLGGALGADHWATEWLLERSEACWSVVPFSVVDQPKLVRPALERYKEDGRVVELQLPRSRRAYLERNRIMVEHSEVVIGFGHRPRSGTAATLRYGLDFQCEVHAYPVRGIK